MTETNATEATSTSRLAERVATRLAELSPAELRVAAFVSEHAEDVAFLSVNDLARQLQTSDATIVRTAQALGYAGFPDLRRELIDAVRNQVSPALRLGRGLESLGDTPAALLDRSIEAQIELLQQARRTVRAESFDQAVDILDAADRILTFGIEAAGYLTQTFALRLRRIGRDAQSISASGAGLADTLLTMRRGDALVAIADEHSPTELSVVLAEAREHAVPVILLTDTLSARSAEHFSVALISSRGDAGSFKTLTTTAVLLDTLLLGLAARDRARSLLSLEQFDRLRSQLTGRRSRHTET